MKTLIPIGQGQINFPFTMAPMVGLSHIALRRLVQEYLPANVRTWYPTEMLSSRRLPHQKVGETPETIRENDVFLVPQILGNERKHIEASIKKLEQWGASGIDINMGCPVQKALKHNYGVALMGNPDYAAEVVKITRESTNLPLSVKLRAADQNDHQVLIAFVEKMMASGMDWVCLHPRTAAQKRKGNADWEQIALLKKELDIPVVGNGDVQVFKDALDMKEQTNCDGVMVGRALTARPWLFLQVAKALGFEINRTVPYGREEEAIEYGKSLYRFSQLLEESFDEKQARKRFLFHLKVSSPWLNYGHSLVKRLQKAENFDHLREEIIHFFEKPGLSLYERTELRY